MANLLRIVALTSVVALVNAASVTLVGVTTGGASPSTSSSVNYFSSGSLTISGLSGDCQLRLRAAELTSPATPGTFSAWYSGKLDEKNDKLLEAYGHHWYLATATSVTYSSLPDGYYLFTASCGTPYTDSNDYFFKVDSVAPTTTITPKYTYDPSPKTLGSYSFMVTVADTHGSSPVYSSATDVTMGSEKSAMTFKWRVDSGSWHKPSTNPSSYHFTLELGFKEPGPHCLEIMGVDATGHSEEYYTTYCWTVESHIKSDGCSFMYSVNGAEYVATDNDYATMESLPDGTNSVAVKAVDMYGNPTVDGAINTFSWTVDAALPITTISSGWASTEPVTSTKGTFMYSSSETGSFYKYQVDSGAIITADTATTQAFSSGTFSVDSCAGTTHSFSVMSVDPVGNVGDASTQTFLVEPINTMISVANGGDGGSFVASTTVVFNIGAIVDTSAPDSFTYEYAINDGAWTMGKHFPKFGLKDLPEGSHTLKARAITSGGCTDPTPATLVFTVDLTPPVVTFLDGCSLMDPYVTNETHATLCGEIVDVNVKPTGAQYKVGMMPYSSAGNPLVASTGAFCVNLENLVEGQYDIAMKSVDKAGNAGMETVCPVIVDGKIPDTKIEFGPSSPTNMESEGNYTFGFSCSEHDCTFLYSVNEQPHVAAVPDDLTPHYFTLSLLPTMFSEGTNTLKVTAVDVAGNADPSPAYFTFTATTMEVYNDMMINFNFKFIKPTDDSPTPMTYTFPVGRIYCVGDDKCD